MKLTRETNQTVHCSPHDFCEFWLFCFLTVTSVSLGDLVLSESLVPPGSHLSQLVSSFLSEQTYTFFSTSANLGYCVQKMITPRRLSAILYLIDYQADTPSENRHNWFDNC